MQPQAVSDPPDAELAGAGPRLADGVELLGPYRGSGYREARYVVARADGQVVQVSELLYRLAEAMDSPGTPAELAGRLSAGLGRDVAATQVMSLIDTKLRPAGLVAAGGTAAPGDPQAAEQRPDHLMMLRHRLPVVPDRVSWRIAGIFLPLHQPVAVAVLLTVFVGLDVAILATGGLSAVVPSALAIVDQPALTLLVLGMIVASGMFHECGHVSACRFSGARPGSMGMGIYLVWPAFYSTVTDSYRLSRAGRLRTDLGGIYFNCLFITAMSAGYLATDAPWLLVAILALHVETARQFLPSIRLDGYYILSDVIGLPDLFTFLTPVLKSVVPGRPRDPRLAQLKPVVRRTIVAWVALVVPFLAFFLISFVVMAPQVLPALWDTLQEHLMAGAAAVRAGAAAAAALSAVQAGLLLLPVLGTVLILAIVLRRLAGPLLPPRRPKPESRPVRVLVVVAVPVLLIGLLALAALDQGAATAGEALTAARVAGVVPATWSDAVVAQQIAAVQALLAGLGQVGVIDGVRAAMVFLGVLTSLLLWPVCRRLAMSPPVAGVAVASIGLAGPLVALHQAVDPGGIAAVWLVLAAVLAGRSRGATTAAFVAAGVAVLTAPVAATGLLAFTAHGVLTGQLAERFPRRGRYVLAAAAVAAAAAAGIAAVGGRTVGAGPPDALLSAGVLVVGAVLVVCTWYRLTPLRPVATGVAAVLAVAAVPGQHSTTALLLAAPALAVLTAALLQRSLGRGQRGTRNDPARRGARMNAVLAVVVVVGIASSWPVVAAAAAVDPDRQALAGWIRAELGPETLLQGDPLTTAQLLRDGIASTRMLPSDEPPQSGVAVVHVPRAGSAPRPAGRVLAEFPGGPGGATATVLLPGAVDSPGGAERERLGRLLAGNPRLTLDESAKDALRAGAVDLRVVAVLSGLTSVHRLGIAGFPAVDGEPADAPRRSVVIRSVDEAQAAADGAELVRRWLLAQQTPYRPDAVRQSGNDLIVHYPTP